MARIGCVVLVGWVGFGPAMACSNLERGESPAARSETDAGVADGEAAPWADDSQSPEPVSTGAPVANTQSPSVSGSAPSTPPTPVPYNGLPLHHLTASEYNATVADLLGIELRPADYFPAAGGSEFDTHASVLSNLPDVLTQGYYTAATDLAKAAFAEPTSRSRVLDCDPASFANQSDELACAQTFIAGFGRRAWRRPLNSDEQGRLLASYELARAELGMDADAAAQHVARLLLASPHFFLRAEVNVQEDLERAAEFALASRLSYLIWSSAPDTQLLDLAENAQLSSRQEIVRQVERLLADPKSERMVSDFLGQWLGLQRLASHDVDPEVFSFWTPELASAVAEQANTFVHDWLAGRLSWRAFLSAEHPQVAALEPILSRDPSGVRSGFLTLPAYLILTSHADRTSPTTRAKTLLSSLLCTEIAPPANVDIPDLSASGANANDEAQIRQRLAEHASSPDCAGCHAVLDPLGLSFEHFDAVGQYRATYRDGTAVDASGEYQGVAFDAVGGLIEHISDQSQFAACPTKKLLSYGLRRSLSHADTTTLETLTQTWNGGSLRELLVLFTTNDLFVPQLQP